MNSRKKKKLRAAVEEGLFIPGFSKEAKNYIVKQIEKKQQKIEKKQQK